MHGGEPPPRISGLSRQGAPAGKYLNCLCTAGSPCGQVFRLFVYVRFRFYRGGFLGGEPPRASIWVSRVRWFSFLMQGISRRGARAGKYFGLVVYGGFRFYCRGFLGAEPALASVLDCLCMFGFISVAGDFSTSLEMTSLTIG